MTWGSNTTSTATISNASESQGLATSTGLGTTTISATLGSVSGSTTLTVTPATLVSIAITPTGPSIPVAGTEQFIATGTYTDKSTQNLTTSVTWVSSNVNIASISDAAGSNGLATAVGIGSASITAASSSVVSPAATLTVTAAPVYAYAADPATTARFLSHHRCGWCAHVNRHRGCG